MTAMKKPKQATPAHTLVSVPPINCEISARIFEGFQIRGSDGGELELVAMDKNGNIIDRGASFSRAVFGVCVETHRQFLIGEGHLRILSKPPTIYDNPEVKAQMRAGVPKQED